MRGEVYPLPVGSSQELRDRLDDLVAKGLVFARMLVQTHGEPGEIRFGEYPHGTTIYWRNWETDFSNRNYEKLFPTFAKIYFDGCNVAQTDSGSKFLIAAGRVFLKGMGGVVSGWTDYGWGYPGWVPFIGGPTIHPGGTFKEFTFRPGGSTIIMPDDYADED